MGKRFHLDTEGDPHRARTTISDPMNFKNNLTPSQITKLQKAFRTTNNGGWKIQTSSVTTVQAFRTIFNSFPSLLRDWNGFYRASKSSSFNTSSKNGRNTSTKSSTRRSTKSSRKNNTTRSSKSTRRNNTKRTSTTTRRNNTSTRFGTSSRFNKSSNRNKSFRSNKNTRYGKSTNRFSNRSTKRFGTRRAA